MCGICGVIDENGVSRAHVEAMTEVIAHRGPDDMGVYIDGSAGLGSSRLSIIDIPGGAQPIANEDGSMWIVLNGEIYNYRDLRTRLLRRGHTLTTQSDTEVVLHLYEDLGPDCVEQLRGMFAFAIWDTRKKILFLARDRLGQKPLYYSFHQGVFRFGSEIKALLAADGHPRQIDKASIYHYLSLRFIPSPGTMFKHIKKLPPGHHLTLQRGAYQISRYWDLTFEEKESRNGEELLDGLEAKLFEVVRAHLVSDVPVGAFLSGGLDSSMIVALMAGAIDAPPKTFAIGVRDQSFNELPFAQAVATHVGTEHYEEQVQFDSIALLPKMIWHLDEPSDPIAACMYHAAGLAARHVKVVLGGDGGDELFAGFDRYLGMHYLGYYGLLPRLVREKVIGPALSAAPESFRYKSWSQRARWIHEVGSAGEQGAQYAAATTFFRFTESQKSRLLKNGPWHSCCELDSSRIIAEIFEKAPADSLTDRMLYTDIVTRLPEHSLMLTDRMTMAHGLEARSPFLDHELVEYLARFPADLKIRNGELKAILRGLARKHLPPAIVEREKQGFMFPVASWFRGPLYPFIRESLMKSTFVEQEVFDRRYVEVLLDEHREARFDHHVRLWMLLNLVVWHSMYIEGQTPELAFDAVRDFDTVYSTSPGR